MSRDEERDDRPGDLPEDDFMQTLLGPLDGDLEDPPEGLPERTIRKVQAELTSRDLIDLTTFVFLMRFCAPLLDLLAAFFGHDPAASGGRSDAQPPPTPEREPSATGTHEPIDPRPRSPRAQSENRDE